MKIAVAVQDDAVCPHFGHAPFYALFTVDEKGNILDRTNHPNPGHAPGVLPKWLGSLESDVIIAGGMGPSAEELFRAQGIDPVIGVSGDVEEAVKNYCSGVLELGPSACHHGSEDTAHHCEHDQSGENR
jgi:predicted Fe-Mo cluster-binding NifX family protein